jgi:hypothetical protein
VINPAEIVDNLVLLLLDIPELLNEVGGDEDRIFAYHDRYGKNVSLDQARYQMPAPSVMVAWQGTSPGSMGGFEVWKHDLSVSLRAGKEEDGEDPAGYYRLFRLITKGVPTSLGLPLINATVHPSFQPMDTPGIRRQTDAAGVDYFEISMSFTEIGDD